MSLDFTHDYSNHNLLDNSHKYSKLYKLSQVDASGVNKGDMILLKTDCGEYGMFIVTEDTDSDGTLHVSKLTEFLFTKDGTNVPFPK